MRFLVTAELDERTLARLGELGDVVRAGWGTDRQILSGSAWYELLATADVALVEFEQIGRAEIAHAPRLRLVGVARGTQMVTDVAALTEQGIAVITTPGRNAQSVIELTMAFTVLLARNVGPAMAQVRDGQWRSALETFVDLRGRELASLTLGLVGFGAIGQGVAHQAVYAGMRVIVHDPYYDGDRAIAGIEFADLEELLARADIVSLHAAVTPETVGLIDATRFRQMKPGAMLINTARSALVVTTDLVTALRNGTVAGAALDVFDQEPLDASSPLRDFPSVILTPHIGGATVEVIRRHSQILLDGVEDWLVGRRPVTCVNPGALRFGASNSKVDAPTSVETPRGPLPRH